MNGDLRLKDGSDVIELVLPWGPVGSRCLMSSEITRKSLPTSLSTCEVGQVWWFFSLFVLLLIRDTLKAIRRMVETTYLYNVGISYEEYTVKVLGTAQLLKCSTHKRGDPSLICNTHFGCCFVLFF